MGCQARQSQRQSGTQSDADAVANPALLQAADSAVSTRATAAYSQQPLPPPPSPSQHLRFDDAGRPSVVPPGTQPPPPPARPSGVRWACLLWSHRPSDISTLLASLTLPLFSYVLRSQGHSCSHHLQCSAAVPPTVCCTYSQPTLGQMLQHKSAATCFVIWTAWLFSRNARLTFLGRVITGIRAASVTDATSHSQM